MAKSKYAVPYKVIKSLRELHYTLLHLCQSIKTLSYIRKKNFRFSYLYFK
nr:MAG TPA: hypothetical protein [Caudoviricetes sp.]